MDTLSELSLINLEWKQPSAWQRRCILQSAAGELGWLAFTSAWRETAEAEIGSQAWKFDRTGFFKRQVLAWRAGETEPCAVFYPNFWGSAGKLELADGTSFELTSNFWQTRFELWSADELPGVIFYKGGMFKLSVAVQVSPAASALPELPLLVALGMYLIMLHGQDAAAATAASSA